MPIHSNIFIGLDSSFSVYNNAYKQSYHSKSMGAYSETLIKHIFPALFFSKYGTFSDPHTRYKFLQQIKLMEKYVKVHDYDNIKNIVSANIKNTHFNDKPFRILDICFGLGYNAMLALQFFQKCEIYSPEQDNLLQELYNFPYTNIPKSKEVINSLIKNNIYISKAQSLYFLHGNALDYLDKFPNNFFNIVFQDAFSMQHNKELWDIDYFKKLHRITTTNCLITTYAKARNIVEIVKLAGFETIKYKYGSLFYKTSKY